jgi:hypothetical protein
MQVRKSANMRSIAITSTLEGFNNEQHRKNNYETESQ